VILNEMLRSSCKPCRRYQGIGRRLERSMKAQASPSSKGWAKGFQLNPLESVTVKIELSEEGGRKGQGLNAEQTSW